MMDFARLVHAAWDEGAPPLKVFGPAPLAQITEGYFGANGVLSHDLRARTELLPSQEVWKARGGILPRPWPAPEIVEIQPGFRFDGDGWSLSSCEVPHAQPALQCMGFAVETDEKKFVYSGDAGICRELEELCTGADLLLHWCYRLDGEESHPLMIPLTPTPSQIAQMAKTAGVKRLLLTHFRIHMDSEVNHAAALEAVRGANLGDVAIVEDLDVFDI
jgi:ribonuclease BN (tRNA processing enzyme)